MHNIFNITITKAAFNLHYMWKASVFLREFYITYIDGCDIKPLGHPPASKEMVYQILSPNKAEMYMVF